MYLLLLVFGGVLAAAGIVLAGFSVSLHEHTFDTSIMTPGVVAAVGGLLLIGLGLALRLLARIERALDAQSMQRAEPVLTAQPEPALLHSPNPTLQSTPTPTISAATAPLASAGERPAQDAAKRSAPAMSPLIARLEASRSLAATEVPHPDDAAAPFRTSVDIAVAQVDKVQAAKRRNGASPPRIVPRLDSGARPQNAGERPLGPSFDALWPKASRLGPVQASPAPAQAAATPAPEPELMPESPDEVPQAAAVSSVAVLKSGVVDGMAYTLYSDGSIEAQLPQGTLRFGSITELRHHIEQSASA